MNTRLGNLINVIATGFIVLAVFSFALFCGRLFCNVQLMESMPWEYKTVAISPSGLVPGEGPPRRQNPPVKPDAEAWILIDPNTRLSAIQSNIADGVFKMEAVGFVQQILREKTEYQYRDEKGIYYRYADKNNYLLFNNRSGLFVCKGESSTKTSGGEQITEISEAFAGPNGISENASTSLGRFEKLIVSRFFDGKVQPIYDRNKRCFFTVDFNKKNVIKGLELAKGDSREPVAMGWIQKGTVSSMSLRWLSPEVKDVNGEWVSQKLFLTDSAEPDKGRDYRSLLDPSKERITVLARNGRIYELDTVNWSLRETGYLPVPASVFSSLEPKGVAAPVDLLAYEVHPIYSYLKVRKENQKSWDAKDVKYLGMCVGSLSREGTALAVVVFDPNGKLIYRADTQNQAWSSAEAIYGRGGESVWTLGEYIVENLHPPVLEAASYLCGNCFEASAGHRALFILPNSFLGILGRDNDLQFLQRQVLAFVLMGPSLILSFCLAWKVRKDAKLTGLSNTAGKWWTAGTIAFGLPAYITYRLTRHKEVLITCQNCGRMRRPDMENCHHCGSKWEMPDLIPPNWRICD